MRPAPQAAGALLTAAFGSQMPEGNAAEQPLGLISSQLDGKASPTEYLGALEACQGAVCAVLDLHRRAVEQTILNQ